MGLESSVFLDEGELTHSGPDVLSIKIGYRCSCNLLLSLLLLMSNRQVKTYNICTARSIGPFIYFESGASPFPFVRRLILISRLIRTKTEISFAFKIFKKFT